VYMVYVYYCGVNEWLDSPHVPLAHSKVIPPPANRIRDPRTDLDTLHWKPRHPPASDTRPPHEWKPAVHDSGQRFRHPADGRGHRRGQRPPSRLSCSGPGMSGTASARLRRTPVREWVAHLPQAQRYPSLRRHAIVIDPRISFGRPTVACLDRRNPRRPRSESARR